MLHRRMGHNLKVLIKATECKLVEDLNNVTWNNKTAFRSLRKNNSSTSKQKLIIILI